MGNCMKGNWQLKIESCQFSIASLTRRSLCHYWRSNAAVVLGIATAAAALVGSLLVGDSVKGSLREIALERLGGTDYALATERFFREKLADDLHAVPAIMLNGTAKHTPSGTIIPRVNVLGIRHDFWRLGAAEPPAELTGRGVILNQTLAEDLGAAEGDAVLVTVGRHSAASTDTVFGRRDREHTVRTMRLIVRKIIPSRGMGSFSLRTDQPRPRNLHMSLSWLQKQLKREGRANTLLVRAIADADSLEKRLASVIKLDDYGLRVVENERRAYASVESRQLVLPSTVVDAAKRAASETDLRCELTSVYLANSLTLIRGEARHGDAPYSIVAGLKLPDTPPLRQKEMMINAWLAKDLGAKAGDTIEMSHYVSDERGQLRTARRGFAVRGVIPMNDPILDPHLVPEFEGITDADAMQEWDPPFPIDLDRIRQKDEDYWDEYRATPKAFVSLATARSLWLSDATAPGAWITSLRLIRRPASASIADAFTSRFLRNLKPAELGFTIRPVKAQALQAAKGSTDFGVLFLSMSMFLVAAAAGLVGLLLRLTVERRASQYGILLATGFTPRSAARILMGEGVLLALIGVALGLPLGAGYAWLIIYALRTWWAGAVGEFVFSLHVPAVSLVVGALASLAIAAATTWWSTRILGRTQALSLLAGWRAIAAEPRAGLTRRSNIIGVASLCLGALLLALSVGLGAISPTGAFFGIGAALLVGFLALFCAQLQRREGRARAETLSLSRLAWRGASRNWMRSMLTVGLLACASFIIVTVAANRKDLVRLDTRERSSGAGGFNLVARSDMPIHYDLSSVEGRKQFSIEPSVFPDTRIIPLRMTDGDDVSCLNIQRVAVPRVLGVPHELIERGGFTFAKIAGDSSSDENPWKLLEEESGLVVPAFADAATAQWVLRLGLGDEIQIPGVRGENVRLRIVGMLANSIFASELLIAEEPFRRFFGSDSGYRYFLMETPPQKERQATSALREGLGDLGFDVTRTADKLAKFARVQNTYLATFQTLGGLGLLLGTFGIVTVLLRNVVERRSELAMLLALGFRRWRVVGIILLENGLLLILGVVLGTAAALVAVAPHLISVVADVRWGALAATLAVCVAVGFVSCAVAAASSVRGELLSALRSE